MVLRGTLECLVANRWSKELRRGLHSAVSKMKEKQTSSKFKREQAVVPNRQFQKPGQVRYLRSYHMKLWDPQPNPACET